MLDPHEIKKDFPYFRNKDAYVYLDTAATSQKPSTVIDALINFYQNEYATVHRAIYDPSLVATEKYDNTRKAVKGFINARAEEEIIFTRGATNAINLVALTYGEKFVNKGDLIVISEMEHHSNLVPWQMLADRKNARLKVIPIDENGELDLDEYDKLLAQGPKLVAIGHMANSTGTINPVKEMIAKAHKSGAVVLIDGAQAIGHLPLDVQQLDADFYAFSSHKMYGPNGIGILYGKKELLEKMPPLEGGGDMIEKVTFERTTYQSAPLKFEAGTPTIAEAVAFKAAIDYIEKLKREEIFSLEQDLLKYCTEKIIEIDSVKIIGNAKEKGGIISFIVKDLHPLDIGTVLNHKRIALRTGHHCAQPVMHKFNIPATARVSFGVYTSKEDIDYFIKNLKSAIRVLKG